MKTNWHLCIDVSGVLRMSKRDFNRQFKGVMTDNTGRVMTVAEAREYFEDARAKGHRVVPTTSKCEGFDFERGCPGHPIDEPATASELVDNVINQLLAGGCDVVK